MASTRTTFTLEADLAAQARRLGLNISAAAREGVAEAVRKALEGHDRAVYERAPEAHDPSWERVEAWGED
ncbi:MAG: type II toxin-antitoxin system CcdA family antitoxin [Solirubrobacterales bacterium]